MNRILFLILLIAYFGVKHQVAFAQTYRYMDSAGNINFVDRPELVPERYRNQVPALITPIVRLDPKQARILEQKKEKQRRELERKKESQRLKREKEIKKLEKERQKNLAKKKKSGKKQEQVTVPTEEEGDFSQVPEQDSANTP